MSGELLEDSYNLLAVLLGGLPISQPVHYSEDSACRHCGTIDGCGENFCQEFSGGFAWLVFGADGVVKAFIAWIAWCGDDCHCASVESLGGVELV